MSADLRELTEFFKDRIDELYLLEQRIGEKADALSVVTQNCISANEAHVNKTFLRIDTAVHSIDKINQAAERVDRHISFCTRHVKLALGLFFGSLFLAICIWASTYFWYKHVTCEVAEAKLELAQANVKLRNKPIFLAADNSMSSTNGDYVRIVPNTEGTLTHPNGKPYQGVYAEVWHRG